MKLNSNTQHSQRTWLALPEYSLRRKKNSSLVGLQRGCKCHPLVHSWTLKTSIIQLTTVSCQDLEHIQYNLLLKKQTHSLVPWPANLQRKRLKKLIFKTFKLQDLRGVSKYTKLKTSLGNYPKMILTRLIAHLGACSRHFRRPGSSNLTWMILGNLTAQAISRKLYCRVLNVCCN